MFISKFPILIAGPCVLETLDISLEIAKKIKEIAEEMGFDYIFKASFDKANRTSIKSYRGPGIEKGLDMLSDIKTKAGVKVISDIHTPDQAEKVKDVLDIIQIPAFLCRQTDLIVETAKTGKPLNIKKAQFMSPWEMKYPVEKAREAGAKDIFLTERGTMFGYNNLVVDFRSIPIMKSLGCPVIFDATHSVQLPGAGAGCSGGNREFVPLLAKAAFSVGADGIFMEAHPDPEKALCDGPNSIFLDDAGEILKSLMRIKNALSGN